MLSEITRLALRVTLTALLLAGCGGSGAGGSGAGDTAAGDAVAGDPGGAGPGAGARTTLYETLLGEGFRAAAQADDKLGAQVAAMESAGYDAFVRGVHLTTDAGVEVYAGVFADGGGALRTALRWCSSGGCTVTTATPAGDAYSFEAVGFSPEPLPVPVLGKELIGEDGAPSFDAGAGTRTISLALTLDSGQTDFNFSRRTLEVLTPLGAPFDTSALEALLREPTLQVEERLLTRAAKRADVERVLSRMDPGDTAVWVGGTVLQVASTGPDGKTYKAVGLSVAVDPLVDATWDFKAAGAAVRQSPFYGPGTLLLVGCESLPAYDVAVKETLVRELSRSYSNDGERNATRLLAGFSGCDHSERLLDAARRFLARIHAGETVAAAEKAANDALAASGSSARLVAGLGEEAAPERPWPQVARAGWTGRKPAGGKLVGHLLTTPKCARSDGSVVQGDEGDTLFIADDLVWEGAAFRGSFGSGGLSGNVAGLLPDPRPGATFYFVFWGDPQTDVRGIVFYGEAKIDAVKDLPGALEISFGGEARTTAFSNDAGELCTMQRPASDLQSPLGAKSKLTIQLVLSSNAGGAP